MIKRFADFFRKKEIIEEPVETQKELNKRLMNSIENGDYWAFTDAIQKGADINHESIEMGYTGAPEEYTITPLTSCIMHGEDKMIKDLLNLGVELNYPDKTVDDDIYDYILKIMGKEDGGNIIKLLIKKYPNYMEERKLRIDSKKYNI